MQLNDKVGIIIINWNSADDTIECLESLRHIDHANHEIVVVDNASNDDSKERIRKSFPDIHLIENSENLGFVGGNNAGISYFLGRNIDFVLLLNNDTIVNMGFLSALVKEAEKEPAAGIFGAKIYYFNDNKKIWFGGGYFSGFSGKPYHYKNDFSGGEKKIDFITGCCLLVRIKVMETIGVLDPDYFFTGEDVDFCIRASRAGFGIRYVPGSVIWHKVSASLGGVFTPVNVYYQFRNSLLLARKNGMNGLFFHISFYFTVIRKLGYFLVTGRIDCITKAIEGLSDYYRNICGKRPGND